MSDLNKLKELKKLILELKNINEFNMDIMNEDGYYLAVWVKDGELK